MFLSSRRSDDTPPGEGLDLLGQQMALLVAVAQLAVVSVAPAPDGAVSGDGEAVAASCRRSNDALSGEGLDLLRQQLVLLVAVAQLALPSIAPAPDSSVSGEVEAVRPSSRHSDDALASKGLDRLRQQLCSCWSPWPNWAKVPRPQLQTLPCAVRARLW